MQKRDDKLLCIYVIRSASVVNPSELVVLEYKDYFKITTRGKPIDQFTLSSLLFNFFYSEKIKDNRINQTTLFCIMDTEILFEKEEEYNTIYQKLNPIYSNTGKCIVFP